MFTWITCTALTMGLAGPSGPERLLCPAGPMTHPQPMAAEPAMPAVTPTAETRAKPLMVSVGGTIWLQMSSKRPITEIRMDRPRVVRVEPVYNDQTTITITGLKPGLVRITLTDDTGRREDHSTGKPGN